ncbi:hypothetical protein XH86_12195 [Bradyrhizobium guangdongense]|uniref:Uncharacterized protein n=1 Tax=Bradyrhizobium guangdongense TaxID=1325090 RepID=A0ABX6UET7_9BRAD|nr:hypothetical protein X265_12195 [Bradyrhizobium guangdongense]QOZ59404.1 hypothetical protein XH86_12195 [Bradyrhizobium guangdongense]
MLLPHQQAKLARGAKDKEHAISQTPNTGSLRSMGTVRTFGAAHRAVCADIRRAGSRRYQGAWGYQSGRGAEDVPLRSI